MAEQSAQNVVNQAQLVGETSSTDVSGTFQTSNDAGAVGGGEEEAILPDEIISTAPELSQSTPSTSAKPAEQSFVANEDATNSSSESVGAQPLATEGLQEPIINGNNGDNVSDDVGYEQFTSGDNVQLDIDLSKADGTEQSAGDGISERLNAVKRPTSFKTVSVTKNFLAKSASGSAVTAKPVGEKRQSPFSAE